MSDSVLKSPPRCRVKVALLAPNGSSQPVQLVIQVGHPQIIIESAEGAPLQQLPLQRILKAVKSSERQKTPGPPNCLDLQIKFPDGDRELRLKCNSEKTVEDIISAITNQQAYHMSLQNAQVRLGRRFQDS